MILFLYIIGLNLAVSGKADEEPLILFDLIIKYFHEDTQTSISA